MTSTHKIKVGQLWRTRGGKLAKIIEIDDGPSYPICSDLYGEYWHTPDGHSCLDGNSDHDCDLVELVQDSDQDSAAQSPRQQALDACAAALAAGRLTPDEARLIRAALEAQS